MLRRTLQKKVNAESVETLAIAQKARKNTVKFTLRLPRHRAARSACARRNAQAIHQMTGPAMINATLTPSDGHDVR
jgi:hypothetical protein